jgi:hypothetical protein
MLPAIEGSCYHDDNESSSPLSKLFISDLVELHDQVINRELKAVNCHPLSNPVCEELLSALLNRSIAQDASKENRL